LGIAGGGTFATFALRFGGRGTTEKGRRPAEKGGFAIGAPRKRAPPGAEKKLQKSFRETEKFPTFALRFGGRGDAGKATTDGREKKFYFSFGKGKSFSTFALRFGGRGWGLKEGKREVGGMKKSRQKIFSFFICGKEKVSYLCSPKRNGSRRTEFGGG